MRTPKLLNIFLASGTVAVACIFAFQANQVLAVDCVSVGQTVRQCMAPKDPNTMSGCSQTGWSQVYGPTCTGVQVCCEQQGSSNQDCKPDADLYRSCQPPKDMNTMSGCSQGGDQISSLNSKCPFGQVCCASTAVPTSEGNVGGENTNASCTNEVKTECGVATSDTAYSYICSANCSSYGVGATEINPGTEGEPCSDPSFKCCKVQRCASAGGGGGTSTTTKPPTEYKLANPLGTASIPVILGRIIKTFLGIVGALALAAFVYGGVMWMTARGDSAQVKKGQDAIKTAVIGLFLIMFANAIAGSYLTFWTAQQSDIAQQEGRTPVEAPTVAQGQLGATIESQQAGQAQVTAGQQAASQAGQQQGVSTPPSANCSDPNLTPAQQQQCQSDLAGYIGTGQSTYNTPAPTPGFGGQPSCPPVTLPPSAGKAYQDQVDARNKCLGKTSTIGYKTICNETVFDSGYGSFNNTSCRSATDCQTQGGSILNSDCSGLAAQFVGTIATWVGSHCGSALGSFGNNCGGSNVCCRLP